MPIAIRGTRALLPPGHRTPRHASVVVDVGETITTDQPGWTGAIELQRTTRDRMLAHCEEPDIA